MIENIRLAFQGIWGHKMRSVLTMLGIIIGIAAIITIVSTIRGTNEQIKENLIGAGNNVVTVQLNQAGYSYDMGWNAIPEGVRVITEETRQELEELKLNPAVEDTPENYERYWKNRKMAQDKMGQSVFVQSYLEQPEQQPGAPVNEQALDDLNAASYQGNYAELRELSKKLKKEEDET